MSMYVLYPSKGNNCWKSATFHSRFYHFELVPTEVHSILRGDNSQDNLGRGIIPNQGNQSLTFIEIHFL